MSSPRKKHRILNALFMIFVILATLWLVLSSVYLILRTIALKEQRLPSVFGYQISAEMTRRMEDTIPIGSVVLAVEKPNVVSGDIVLYQSPGQDRPVSGRIKSILSFDNDPEYAVSFDAETAVTVNVYRSEVLGQAVYIIPYLGYVVDYLNTSSGVLFAVLIPGIILVLLLVIRMVGSIRAGRREGDQTEEEEYAVTPIPVEREISPELAYRNEELDAIWKQQKAGSGETEEIVTDQDMVYQLSNLNNTFANPDVVREQEQLRQTEAEQIVSEFSQTESEKDEESEQPELPDAVELTQAEANQEENISDYDRLIADLGIESKESSDWISMLRQYGITDQETVDSVQKAAPFIRPVVTDHSVDLDLEDRPAQRVRVVSDEYGKFLIVESNHVETKVKLPF